MDWRFQELRRRRHDTDRMAKPGDTMDESHSKFAFVDRDRTFTCHVERSCREPAEAWWWFQVSTESHQRHAPFRAEVTDTRGDVQARMVAYYDNLLARRAEPARPRWERRPTTDAAPATTAATT
jgi:hypothetical protein